MRTLEIAFISIAVYHWWIGHRINLCGRIGDCCKSHQFGCYGVPTCRIDKDETVGAFVFPLVQVNIFWTSYSVYWKSTVQTVYSRHYSYALDSKRPRSVVFSQKSGILHCQYSISGIRHTTPGNSISCIFPELSQECQTIVQMRFLQGALKMLR